MPVSGTSITSSSDVVNAHIEKVNPNVPALYEKTSKLFSLFKASGQEEMISEKLYRLSLKIRQGGNYGLVDRNAGTMNNGSGPVVEKMTAGYKSVELGFELGDQSIFTSDSAEKSRLNTLEDVLSNAIEEMQVYDDIAFHQDGTGKLTNAASSGGTATLVFNSSTDTLKTGLLREGMHCRIYDASGSDFMASDNQIKSIDPSTHTVTFVSNLSEAGAVGDYLVITGITTNPPASFSANYPATSLTADDFIHGLYYFNDYTSSNYVLGLLKSTYPQLMPVAIDADGNSLTFEFIQRVLDGLMTKRNEEDMGGLIGIAHMAQRSVILQQSSQIVSKFVQDSKIGSSVDLQPSNNTYSSTFDACGLTFHPDKRQRRDRIDIVNPSKWGRAVAEKLGFYKKGGTYLFEGRASTGALKASTIIKLVQTYDNFSTDPGIGGVIYDLAIPTGY